jgi:hypothetical protein
MKRLKRKKSKGSSSNNGKTGDLLHNQELVRKDLEYIEEL